MANSGQIANLATLANAARALQNHAETNTMDVMRWTPPQNQWQQMRTTRKLLRCGNQLGKTTAGLSEVIWRCLGNHPHYPTHRPPIEAWIICTSYPQSVGIMGKFWDLVPRNEIRPIRYDPRRGFGKDNPAVVFKNGSVVRFKTTNAGAESLAGSTIHYVHIDEPCDFDVYRELDRRILRNSGQMGITLTPLNKDTTWLRQLVDDGAVIEVHATMTPENLWPVGARQPLQLLDGTPMDQRWIEQQRRECLDRFAPVVLDGEWEIRSAGSLFHAFDTARHVSAELPTTDLQLCVGIDYGSRDFKQIAVLVGVDASGDAPRVYILDEAASDGATTPEQDATAVLRMLHRAGVSWEDLDHAWGDHDHSGKAQGLGKKSNKRMMFALKKRLHIDKLAAIIPPIRQVKRGRGGGRGSVHRGAEWLHQCMLREDSFRIHPRCSQVIESVERWDYRDTPHKDAIDSIRYATWSFAMRGGTGAKTSRSLYVY